MFSLDKFYHILHDNLISKIRNGKSFYHYPFGTTDSFTMLLTGSELEMQYIPEEGFVQEAAYQQICYVHSYFVDQEPLSEPIEIPYLSYFQDREENGKVHLLANSEHSEVKRKFLKENKNFYDWYYFFHGFAALDWYRNFQYFESASFAKFDKVFISYNHLISKQRSYRLHLVSNLINRDLVKHGYVSLQLKDNFGSWKDTVFAEDCPLDKRAKVPIFKALNGLQDPLIIDTPNPHGGLSADVQLTDVTKALWHIVTETIYFEEKLHLTEKIFKPIVGRRPFILVAAPGNLAYLKKYGFKTFDRWIDESYDQETDHYLRIEKITKEIEKLCSLSRTELENMHEEMKEVLDFNSAHFYGDFKKIIVNELVDNFEGALMQFNNGRMPNNHARIHQRFDFPKEYLEEVKQRLMR